MKALVINTEAWHEDANANLRSLKCDVEQCVNGSVNYEKTMWERIEMKLNNMNVENLGFDHLICSGILDIKLEPFINIPESFCDIFKELFQKYKLEQNYDILDTCKEFILNEESKINEDEDLHDVKFEKWLNSSERLQKITRQILESL